MSLHVSCLCIACLFKSLNLIRWVERLRLAGVEPPEDDRGRAQGEGEADRETRTRRTRSPSPVSSSFPETPATRVSRPPSRADSDEVSDSSEELDQPPRKTMRKG